MKILFDTNIILDVLLDRAPHVAASAAIWAAVEKGVARGSLAAHAVTTIHDLIAKEADPAKANRLVAALLTVFDIADVGDAIIREALLLNFSDFEDAVTATAARKKNCAYIVTRAPKGFRGSPVKALTPEALLPLLRS